MRRATAWLLLIIGFFSLASCRPKSEGTSFRFPLSAEPSSLDPQVATDDAARAVIPSLFEGLCALDDGEAVAAAANWTVSEDGKTYVFSLYDSLWSDGQAVTADDFLFAYERMTALPSPPAFLKHIASVTAPRDNALQVTLHAAEPSFLLNVGAVGWYPCRRDFFAACNGHYGMEPSALITNGAFTLATWHHGQSLHLSRHKDFHRASEIAPLAVRFLIGAEETAAALAEGALDACLLEGEAGGTSTVTVDDTLRFLWFNTTVSPLDTAAVRCLLRDAVEWDTVNNALSSPTVSFVAPAALVGSEPYVTALPARQTTADRVAFQKALATAGSATCPAFTLLCEEGENSRQLAQYIVQSWQKNLGVYFGIEQVPSRTLYARLAAGNYHLAIAAATPRGNTPADAMRLFTGTAAGGNWSRLEDKEWAATLDTATTLSAYQTAEQALHALCPAVPLAVTPRVFGIAADIHGLSVVPFTNRLDFHRATRGK